MKAMLLAAGCGTRLKPLTDTIPKPLIKVGQETLIERHLFRLAKAGFQEVVINISYLKEKLRNALGDGQRYGIRILWSDEGGYRLSTGGGIANAFPLLNEKTILVISADIYTDWEPTSITLDKNYLAHLVMVDNPKHYSQGDFALQNGKISLDAREKLTFSGIGYYHTDLFKLESRRKFDLSDVLKIAILNHQVSGEHFIGLWADAGTHASLEQLRKQVETN